MLTRYLRNITLVLLLTFGMGKVHAQEVQSDIDFLKEVQAALTKGVVKDAINMMKDSVGINIYPAFHIADDSALWPYALELYFDVRIERKEPYVMVKLNLNPSTGKWTDFSSYSLSVSLIQGQQKAVPTTVLVAAEKQLNEILANIGNLREYFGKVRDNIAETIQKLRFALMDKYFEGRDLPLVSFYPSSEQQFGFDYPMQQEIISKYKNFYRYDTIQRVPWKALSTTKPDKINAYIQVRDTSFSVSKIRFVNRSDVKLQPFTTKDDTLVFQLTGTSKDQDDEITAEYVETDLKGKERKAPIGQVKTIAYQEETNIVHIVPVGVKYPASEKELEKFLNKVYNQAVTNWTVIFDDPIEVKDWDLDDDKILNIETGIFHRYSDEEQAFIDALEKTKGSIDPKAAYMFVTDVPNNLKARGYMPLSAQFGFIFVNGVEWDTNDEIELLNTTVAHELGHGIYKLKHPWDEYGTLESQTANLLDYRNGNILWKPQWDWIHDPGLRLYMFQKAAEGARVIVSDFSNLTKYAVDGWLTFLSPGGVPISVKMDKLEELHFATSKDEDNLFDLPIGTLARFKYNKKIHYASKFEKSNVFAGYTDYEEDFSFQKKYTAILGGIPCLKNHDIVFKIFPLVYTYTNDIPLKNTGKGEIKGELYYSRAFAKQSEAVDVYAKFESGENIDGVKFFINYTNSANLCGISAFYAFKIVSLLEKNYVFLNCTDNVAIDASSNYEKQTLEEEKINSYKYNEVDNVRVSTNNALYLQNYGKSYDKIVSEAETEIKDDNIFSNTYMQFFYEKLSEYLEIVKPKFESVSNLSNEEVSKIRAFFSIQSPLVKECLIKSIPDATKIVLIKALLAGTDIISPISDRKERLILEILSAIKDTKAFILALQTTDKEFFLNLLKSFSGTGEEYDQLVSVLTQMVYDNRNITEITSPIYTTISDANSRQTPKYIEVHKGQSIKDPNDKTVNLSFTTTCSPIDYALKITSTYTRQKETEYYNGIEKHYSPISSSISAIGDIFALVEVKFSTNFQILGPDNKPINTGATYLVPMFWVKWFLEKQQSINNSASIRVLLNLLAGAISVATLEPGPLLFIELTINGVDIIVSINEDKILSGGSKAAKELLDTYNKLMLAYGVVVGTQAVNSITKNVYSFVSRTPFSAKLAQFKKVPEKLADLSIATKNVFTQTVNTIGKEWSGYAAWKAFNESLFFEAELYRMSNQIRNFEISVEQANKVVIKLLDPSGALIKEARVAEAAGDISTGTVVLKNLKLYDQVGDGVRTNTEEAIGYLNNVKVTDGTNTYTKSYRIYDGANGGMYLLEEVARTAGKFDNFKNVSKLPQNILSKLDDAKWTDDLIKKLDSDLADAKLLEKVIKEPELVESWKVLQNALKGIRQNTSVLEEVAKLRTKTLANDEALDVQKLFDNGFGNTLNSLSEADKTKMLARLNEWDAKHIDDLARRLGKKTDYPNLSNELTDPDLFTLYDDIIHNPLNATDIANHGGTSLWDKIGKSTFFMEVTGLGKKFEKTALNELKAASSTLKHKLISKYNIDLKDYEVFEQVQIKTGRIIDGKEEYFVADFVLVKKDVDAFTGFESLDYGNAVVLETKLSNFTNLTTPQAVGLSKIIQGSKLDVRSVSLGGTFIKTNTLGQANKITFKDYIKVWSDGNGNSVIDIISLK